jgi:hypothetical protein
MLSYLGIFCSEFFEDLLTHRLLLRIRLLAFVSGDLESGFIAFPTGRQKNDRRQQVESAQSSNKFWR